MISNWFLEHSNGFTVFKWPPQSPDISLIEHLWVLEEQEIHIMDVQLTLFKIPFFANNSYINNYQYNVIKANKLIDNLLIERLIDRIDRCDFLKLHQFS